MGERLPSGGWIKKSINFRSRFESKKKKSKKILEKKISLS